MIDSDFLQGLHWILLALFACACMAAGFFTSKSTPRFIRYSFTGAPFICFYFVYEKFTHGYKAYPPDAAMVAGMIFFVVGLIYLANENNVLKREPPARWKRER